MTKIRCWCYIKVYFSKSYCSISITINKLNSQFNHALLYPLLRRHRTCNSIYVFLLQLEPFDYSLLKIVDRQKLVYEMYQEEPNRYKKPSPSIKHKCTVQINDVAKISVNRVIGTSDFLMQIFSVKMYKHDHDKGVVVLFRALITLVSENWTPRLYAKFLCDLALSQSMWMCISLNIKYDNSIEPINGINVPYPLNISKLKYDANGSIALSFIKGGSN